MFNYSNLKNNRGRLRFRNRPRSASTRFHSRSQRSYRTLQYKDTPHQLNMFAAYEISFSPERMASYHRAAGNDALALGLYQANLQLPEALYTPLALLEVGLRNQLDAVLQQHFGQADWLLRQQTGFMRDPRFRFRNAAGQTVTNDFLLRSVHGAEKKLKSAVTHPRLVAELMFGFWTELFDPTPFKILQGQPLTVFRYKPATISRVDVFTRLPAIRKLRNRVYHYEPICMRAGRAELTSVRSVHRQLLDVVHWLTPDLTAMVEHADRFDAVCRSVCQNLPFVQP